MLKELVIKNRSYRQFDSRKKIKLDELKEIISIARLVASGGNCQPLRYILCNEERDIDYIDDNIVWAKSLKSWDGPKKEEIPSAFIIVLADTSIRKDYQYDVGIAVQTILLKSVEKGLGGCIIRDINKKRIREYFHIEPKYDIALILAIGHPTQESFIEDMIDTEDYKYWRDLEGNNHVPKRNINELIYKY